jgi:hypothetical protein
MGMAVPEDLESADEIAVRIEKHETALLLLPEGQVRHRVLVEIARLRSLESSLLKPPPVGKT